VLLLAGDYPKGIPFKEIQRQIDHLELTDAAILNSMARLLEELRESKTCVSSISSIIEASGEVPEGCPVQYYDAKWVFVTSTRYPANFGGLQGADNICQIHANNAGLYGTYKAWLSDSLDSPATRFNKQGGPYRLRNGAIIANDWDELTDGDLAFSIQVDEYGNLLVPDPEEDEYEGQVWTGAWSDGTQACFSLDVCNQWHLYCYQWTQTPSGHWVETGRYTESDGDWSHSWDSVCTSMRHLYCFQQ